MQAAGIPQRKKISIVMITYNHEGYITQAIRSVLDQQCNYEIQFVISNDCSTDNTDGAIRKIIQGDARAECITYIHHEKNVGMMANFLSALKLCTGDYIAILDGDDYWTDKLKLQKQADHLNNHSGCALVFTDFHHIVHQGNEDKPVVKQHILQGRNIPDKSGWQDILIGNYIPTCTCMIRNWLNGVALDEQFLSLSMGDWPLWILTGKQGYFKFLPIDTAAYRVHNTGNYSGIGSLKSMQHQIETLSKLRDSAYFDSVEKNYLNKKIQQQKRKHTLYSLYWRLKKIFQLRSA